MYRQRRCVPVLCRRRGAVVVVAVVAVAGVAAVAPLWCCVAPLGRNLSPVRLASAAPLTRSAHNDTILCAQVSSRRRSDLSRRTFTTAPASAVQCKAAPAGECCAPALQHAPIAAREVRHCARALGRRRTSARFKMAPTRRGPKFAGAHAHSLAAELCAAPRAPRRKCIAGAAPTPISARALVAIVSRESAKTRRHCLGRPRCEAQLKVPMNPAPSKRGAGDRQQRQPP